MLTVIPEEHIIKASKAYKHATVTVYLSDENFKALESGFSLTTNVHLSEREEIGVIIVPPFSKEEKLYDHYPEPEKAKQQFKKMRERTMQKLEDENFTTELS